MSHTLLVIDDEPTIRTVLKKMFEKEGYKALTAENGFSGIRRFEENPVDLVVVDLIMPEKDGIETIRDLTAIDPDIPIIAISGGGVIKPDLYLKMAKKFGAVHSLEKPLDRDALLTLVADLLGNNT